MNEFDFNRPAEEVIRDLRRKAVKVPQWSDLEKLYDHKKHDVITDQSAFKDKVRKDGTIDRSARIPIGFEKLAVKRMSEFCFAIPVKRRYAGVETDTHRDIVKAIERIYRRVHIDTLNRHRSQDFFACCEVATLWFAQESRHRAYGFDSGYKLRCRTYSPRSGHQLYPLFDGDDDMIALSFEYRRQVAGKERAVFETFTRDKRYLWQEGDSGWELLEEAAIKLGKIPAIYMHRQEAIYTDITEMRSELEYTLSRNSNVIGYNSAPILKVAGELRGTEDKGEGRRVYRVENSGDVSYVSWAQSVESINFHAGQMRQMIFAMLQLPDLSFENMKGLGAIGYDARQMLLADAHLKVGDESGALIEFLEREGNIVKEYLKLMNTAWANAIDDIEIEHIITPFIQGDELAEIDKRLKANGGKPIESHLESIARYGESEDPTATLRQIQNEEREAAERSARENVLTSSY